MSKNGDNSLTFSMSNISRMDLQPKESNIGFANLVTSKNIQISDCQLYLLELSFINCLLLLMLH